MLYLDQRIGETIVIGEGVRVRVAEIRGPYVRLAVDAPREIEIHRREVWEAIQAAKKGLVSDRGHERDS